jgi:hypothetical protein
MITQAKASVLEIRCDHCRKAKRLILDLDHARKHDWVVPNDGAFQWCPKCQELHSRALSAVLAWRSAAGQGVKPMTHGLF